MDDANSRAQAHARLSAFLPRAMKDAVLDETEKRELLQILGSGVLTREDVQGIFRAFLQGLSRDVMADGVLTPAEQNRCRAIVSALRIPDAFLPPELVEILSAIRG
jgi:hypothetical protein